LASHIHIDGGHFFVKINSVETKIMSDIKQKIEKLTDQLAKAKAQELLRENASKARATAKARKQRDRKIYQLGGMVEKMGLDGLPDEILLAGFYQYHLTLSKAQPDLIEQLKKRGAEFKPVGKKLARLPPC
jgi:thiamine pyrophosphate-dependent acetolactate synthase large subunit-like protein